jgi:predicted DNA-binding protein YlxM (UPF0122 family)
VSTKIGNEATAKIIEFYKSGMRTEDIAKEIGVHPHTVRSRIKKYENMLEKKLNEAYEEEADEIINQLKGEKPKNIIKKILNILDVEENLRIEFLERGLDPLNRVLGTLMDKAIKLYEIDQQKQMFDEMESSQDNFYTAMSEAIEKLVDVDSMIDEASLTRSEED